MINPLIVLFFLHIAVSADNLEKLSNKNQKEIKASGVSGQCAKDLDLWGNSLKLPDDMAPNCLLHNCSVAGEDIARNNFFVSELSNNVCHSCQTVGQKEMQSNYCYILLIPGKITKCPSDGTSSIFLRSTVCMPASCTSDDLPAVFNRLSSNFTACSAICFRHSERDVSTFWKVAAFFILMISIAIVMTFAHFMLL